MTVTQNHSSSLSTEQTAQQWSYASGTSDTPLLGLTIGDMFDQTAAKYATNLALISRQQHIRLTYSELQNQVNQCAKGLMQLGFKKGDCIGIWAPNRAEWCIAQFATSKIGVILVNINPSYRVHELEYVLRQSGCSALILASQFKTSNYTEMIVSLAPELQQCQPGQLKSAKLPTLTTVIRIGQDKVPGMLSWDELMTSGPSISAEQLFERQRQQEFDDPIKFNIPTR